MSGETTRRSDLSWSVSLSLQGNSSVKWTLGGGGREHFLHSACPAKLNQRPSPHKAASLFPPSDSVAHFSKTSVSRQSCCFPEWLLGASVGSAEAHPAPQGPRPGGSAALLRGTFVRHHGLTHLLTHVFFQVRLQKDCSAAASLRRLRDDSHQCAELPIQVRGHPMCWGGGRPNFRSAENQGRACQAFLSDTCRRCPQDFSYCALRRPEEGH